jgi:hypothetical protein
VLREHSFAAMAALWEAIYARIWYGDPVEPAELVGPDTPATTPATTETVAASV